MSSQGAAAHSARHGAHVPLQNTGTCLRQFKRILPLLSTLSTDATAAIFSLSFNEESGKSRYKLSEPCTGRRRRVCNRPRPCNSPSPLSVGAGSRVCRPLFGGAILTRSLLDDGRQTVALQRSAPQFPSLSGRGRGRQRALFGMGSM